MKSVKNNITKETMFIILEICVVVIPVLLFYGIGHKGYSIDIIWKYELLILLFTNLIVLRRSKYETVNLPTSIVIDIIMITLLMFGYLINFRTIEVFYYNPIYIIIARTLIIILYYLILMFIKTAYNSISKIIIGILGEWMSVVFIVFAGGFKFENVVNDSDNYVAAISNNVAMQVVSYYCMPGKLNFLVGTIVVLIMISALIYFIKKNEDKTTKIQENLI